MRRCLLFVVVVATVLAGAGGALSASRAEAATPPVRYIDVSVATLWVAPGKARAVDAPSLANPADPRRWAASMSLTQKRWLVGRLETQALYGTKVYLLGTSGSWSKVAVTTQPTPRDKRGYPGWLPTRQLTTVAPTASPYVAVIKRPTAWLSRYGAPDFAEPVTEVAYGTRVPVISSTAEQIEVLMPNGEHLFMRPSVGNTVARGGSWPAFTGAQLAASARQFVGLQYLWAGTSGFGYDCSGFTYMVHYAFGKKIPRDAGPQYGGGRRIRSRSSLRAGDLVFFRSSAGIHHVGMYIGRSRMIHAPRTGQPIQVSSILVEPYRSQFAGGARYVP